MGVVGVAALAVAALAGCGSGSAGGTPKAGVAVVASTDVWGDVVEQVAGDLAGSTVTVTSVITDPDADPHTYEANTKNLLAISKADLVVENGGGYDDFVHTMVGSSHSKATVLDAVDLSGKKAPADGELNEHVWYDFPTVETVAGRIADTLAQADPADASTYRANLKAFVAKLHGMERTEATIKKQYAGAGAAITEPVPLYLLQACGLVNRTPEAFSEAIEEDSDVPVGALKQTLDLFADHRVRVLAYNEQTSGPETEQVLKAARANGIAIVPVTETLPDGDDYPTWMQHNLSALRTALR